MELSLLVKNAGSACQRKINKVTSHIRLSQPSANTEKGTVVHLASSEQSWSEEKPGAMKLMIAPSRVALWLFLRGLCRKNDLWYERMDSPLWKHPQQRRWLRQRLPRKTKYTIYMKDICGVGVLELQENRNQLSKQKQCCLSTNKMVPDM